MTQRLPSLSNYIATDVSAWAAGMITVRDHELWRDVDAGSWEDYCTRVVGKPLDWCSWIVNGYEELRAGRGNRPVPEAEALEAGKRMAAKVARADPERDLPGQGVRTDLEPRVDNTKLQRGSTNASYLAARLKRDHPEIAAAERGEFPSMRKAAIAAGIVKRWVSVEPTPTGLAKAAGEMDVGQISELIARLQTMVRERGEC